MTDTPVSTPYAEGDFSVGRVLNRTFSVLTRNFLTFFTVTAVASLPSVLLSQSASLDPSMATGEDMALGVGLLLLGMFVGIVLYTLSQPIVLYGAFQDMRGRPVSLTESLQVGLRRFFSILGLAISMSLLMALGFIFFVVPGFILMSMWFVATPVCVVEQLGPFSSMGRSRRLTKGYRWRIFGLILLLFLISGIISPTLGLAMGAIGGKALVLIGALVWSGVWGAFYAIAAVVAYHDLRAAKEGIDIEQIAAVFD
jgi:MFS family permease